LALFPSSAGAAEYRTFVGCNDLAEIPVPSHVCHVGDFPAAYFESDTDTEYEVCVEFPGGKEVCAEEQFAEGEALYLNSITSEIPGNHFVSWYVEGVEVGSWLFRMDPVPPPPPPPVTLPAPTLVPPPVVVPATNTACINAQHRVTKLKGQLRKATGSEKKAKLRSKLENARAGARQAC
jgi:hypothetical protein